MCYYLSILLALEVGLWTFTPPQVRFGGHYEMYSIKCNDEKYMVDRQLLPGTTNRHYIHEILVEVE
jgi:hypothetical protein